MRKEENGYILFTPEKNLLDLLPQVKVGETIENCWVKIVKSKPVITGGCMPLYY